MITKTVAKVQPQHVKTPDKTQTKPHVQIIKNMYRIVNNRRWNH